MGGGGVRSCKKVSAQMQSLPPRGSYQTSTGLGAQQLNVIFMFLLFRTLWFFMFFMLFKYRKYLYCVFSFKFIYVDYTVSQILVRCCHLVDKYCNVITMTVNILTEYRMGWLFKLKSKYWNYLPWFSLNIHTSIQSS